MERDIFRKERNPIMKGKAEEKKEAEKPKLEHTWDKHKPTTWKMGVPERSIGLPKPETEKGKVSQIDKVLCLARSKKACSLQSKESLRP